MEEAIGTDITGKCDKTLEGIKEDGSPLRFIAKELEDVKGFTTGDCRCCEIEEYGFDRVPMFESTIC
jgi:hypothetical protein